MKPHAIVVGASSGLGARIAVRLADHGYGVSALSRRKAAGAFDRWLDCDVTDEGSVQDAVSRAIAEAGTPAALVYSAGAPVAGRTLAVPEAAARHAFEVNFWGVERVIRHAYPSMAGRGSGTILAVLSIAALRAVPFEAHYAASKAAAARWIGCFALEAQRAGVRVAWLAPGYVSTGFLERAGWHGMAAPASVQGSGVTPDDVASAVLRLLASKRDHRVLGWRENAILLADRLVPGAYDALLRRRVRRAR